MSPITVVESSYGHRFTEADGESLCLTCGAEYSLVPDSRWDEDGYGRYTAPNGDTPEECTGRTDLFHGAGYGGECMLCTDDKPFEAFDPDECPHIVPCNCNLCF